MLACFTTLGLLEGSMHWGGWWFQCRSAMDGSGSVLWPSPSDSIRRLRIAEGLDGGRLYLHTSSPQTHETYWLIQKHTKTIFWQGNQCFFCFFVGPLITPHSAVYGLLLFSTAQTPRHQTTASAKQRQCQSATALGGTSWEGKQWPRRAQGDRPVDLLRRWDTLVFPTQIE